MHTYLCCLHIYLFSYDNLHLRTTTNFSRGDTFFRIWKKVLKQIQTCWNIQVKVFAGFAKYTDFKHKAEVYYLSRKMHNFEFESVKKANLFGLPTLFFQVDCWILGQNSRISPFFEHFLAKISSGLEGGRSHEAKSAIFRVSACQTKAKIGQNGISDFISCRFVICLYFLLWQF